jgi:thymidylate synthase ThyX
MRKTDMWVTVNREFWDSFIVKRLPLKVQQQVRKLLEKPREYVEVLLDAWHSREPTVFGDIVFKRNSMRQIKIFDVDGNPIEVWDSRAVGLVEILYFHLLDREGEYRNA